MPSGEISTTNIVQNALKSGKEVFIPYIHTVENSPAQPKSSVMEMLALESMEEFESLKPDKWGIPSLEAASISVRQNCLGGYGVASAWHPHTERKSSGLDLIVMPGMAFDQSLRRLGHGKGYYDRFLARYSKGDGSKESTPQKPFLVALALKEQILHPPEEIPVSEHDWPVDAVIVGDGQIISP
ncbi:5-formyltetrahydrofolate cyclo-ligase [Paecilomyces variotii No. 5]|uniref:5-formyltetrahydrofolate cyclo-ligase n=1 Tax=Byssochlamys spectabilis (strain No. 5 / NBRC 109023) TaxID=1356009 RepID=V5G4X7_BYSSN|nr:5-formyltetrahydrofolate cyclo-ligase [Paecilomyces variotii No. 5]